MKNFFLALSIISSIVLSTACVDKGANTANTSTGGDTGDIKVGVYGDTTGATSSFGVSTKTAFNSRLTKSTRRAASTVENSK